MGNGVNSPLAGVPESSAETSESLADRAYREIRDRIVMLDIAPGSPINEDQLGSALGIGRTPIREALKRLAHERLVVAYARRGTFATDVNITDLAHISEVRAHLEPIAARSAAERATDQERAELRAILAELGRPRGSTRTARDLMLLDLRIHRSVYAAVHNAYLEDTLMRYDNLANRIWCLFIDRLPDLAAHIEEHGPLLEAVISGDGDRAAELAGKHVIHFESEIRALI
ncbi:GntR family transcriptional regulator [Nocardioides baekrokdamisoli]|uniref:GntR family transcriptional regulator n=1 Tax=Nocardioides baekrokdamisoli TaxID=1804624 RepID=A0A3G9IAN1_9ACTN|nr:GntR family transcriptional regulator [Nocardioides baekrokdamisoli]BBH15807.1 GntR family transcriptional regulator [Nocardioides baekrokdamisoli]